MWFITHWSPVRYRHPYPLGAWNAVFSSPAANVGAPLISQTP
jgi:hypothetical protein